MVALITASNAVGMHVRWFSKVDRSPAPDDHTDLRIAYYQRAIQEIKTHVQNPHFIIFSDDPACSRRDAGTLGRMRLTSITTRETPTPLLTSG